MPLITEQGSAFWPHSSSLSMTRNHRGECQHISNCSQCLLSYGTTIVLCMQFTWAHNWAHSQVQMLRPSQHIWAIWHRDNREPQGQISQVHSKCVFLHIGANSPHRAAEWRASVTSYWLIRINNQTQAAEKSSAHWEQGRRKMLLVVDNFESIKQRLLLLYSRVWCCHASNCIEVIWTNMYLGCLCCILWTR